MLAATRFVVPQSSGIAVGIGRTVASLQTHLMRPMAFWPVDEEALVEFDPAVVSDIEFHHPAIDAVRIELRVDGAVERVGEVDPLSVATDFDHLRAAVERAVVRLGMGSPGHDGAY